MNLLTLLGLAIFAESLTWATPFRLILEKMGIDNHQEPRDSTDKFFQELFACEQCLGFWIGLFWTWSLPQAAIVMLLARLTRALYDSLPTKF